MSLFYTFLKFEIINQNIYNFQECFQNNFVSGKKLIHMTASNLPRIGITDFDHIKVGKNLLI